jgi:hypothetical protein
MNYSNKLTKKFVQALTHLTCIWHVHSSKLDKNTDYTEIFVVRRYRVSNLKSRPITVTARSKARTVFDHSNAWIVGSNPTQVMNVRIVCVYSVCVLLCVGRGLATGWSHVQGVLQTVYRIQKLKKSGHGPTKGCRAKIKLKVNLQSRDNHFRLTSFPNQCSLLSIQPSYIISVTYGAVK